MKRAQQRRTTRSETPVSDVLASPGKPLDPVTRGWAEPRFGRDLSSVRVHTDDTAARAAADIHARAYTAGPHIAFGAGRHRPDTEAGQNLLAHELTHVGQQASPTTESHEALEADAHAQAANVASTRPTSMRAEAPAQAQAVQRFEEHEHRSLGNAATGSASYDLGPANAPLRLTHGEIIMLTGDWFGPTELFLYAMTAGRNGAGLGTQDEVITALQIINRQQHLNDTRFAQGGIWATFTPSQPVREAVQARFRNLAASNASHFAAPAGRDPQTGIPRAAVGGNAGTTYRSLHEQALTLAYQSGRVGTPVGLALSREAAAQHFLTDAFSAGHLRTETQTMRDYWRGIYPLFFFNLLHKIALDTAIRMNDIDTNLTTIIGTVKDMYDEIMITINQIAPTLPEVTLGDLLARVFHDVDNVQGVDIEGGGTVFGDDQLDNPAAGNVTRARAQQAIHLGNQDIREAHTLGAAGGAQLADPALFAEVLRVTQATGTQFRSEAMMPRPTATAPQQNWRAPDFRTLWSQPVRGTSGITIGQQIALELQPNAAIRRQLDELGDRFDPVAQRASGNVHPRRAYLEGFVQPMVANPFQGILSIINWTPNYGLRDQDRDDVSLQVGNELDHPGPGQPSRLPGMTAEARLAYIRELIDGPTGATEEEMVVRIFATCPRNQRQWLYQAVEGHAWTGHLIHGAWVSDDRLWNELSAARAARLDAIISGATP
jgi:hypothetical protein